ncbi:MAG: DHH family phosphoesterase [Prolixibacteraceae bacterium]
MTNIQIETCHSLLAWMKEKVKKIVILTHANPDGDALGSSLGLNSVLQNAGFNSVVVFPTDFPPIVPDLNDYKHWIIFEHHEKKAGQLINEADLIFVLDFNDIKRVGKAKKFLEHPNVQVVLIDHHPQPMIETPFLFSDTKVSSTAELVCDFVVKMGWSEHIDGQAASALLTGIIADTSSFNHNAKRPELYRAVGDLISRGADQDKIHEALFNTNSEDRLRMLGYALSEKMEVYPEFHTAIITLTRNELRKFNFKIGDTEGFVNYPLSIKGIVFSVFFLETEEKIKISLRSKGSFAVNEFSASHFSGGGHHNAAGGESRLSLNEVVQQFVALLPQYAQELEY